LLARAGHRVTLYERVPDPGPVGAGIVLQPIGLHVLSLLGLAEQLLAAGANLALFDALTLASLVTGAAQQAGSLPEALARYTARRRGHLRFYQLMSRALTPFFQSDAPLLGALRDLGMPLAFALAPVRRRMLRTMCWLEQGVVRAPFALPAPAAGV
jgi:2-polyprenyl-6-methoxyphenol hydroxylase-like FAD-dependent oxidoreductase